VSFLQSESAKRIAAAVIVAFVVTTATLDFMKNANLFGNFRAFYCAGQVAAEGANPYYAQPLGRCEHGLTPASLFGDLPTSVLPAPLPGYLIGLFEIFALFPFYQAALLWTLVLVCALAYAVGLVDRLGYAAPLAFTLAAAISIACVSILDGELIPIALLGILLVALGVKDANAKALVGGLFLAMTEPQVGLILALGLCVLSTRWIPHAVLVLGTLLLVSVTVSGPGQTFAYVAVVLPQHVASEVHAAWQFGPTWMAASLGAPDATALLFGHIGYILVALLCIGLALTPMMRERPDIYVLAVPALALCGGAFLHLDHIGLALPASFALAGRPGSWRGNVALPVSLAAPLFFVFWHPLLMVALPVIAYWIVASLARRGSYALWGAAAAVLVVAALAAVVTRFGTGMVALQSSPEQISGLASAAWGASIRLHNNATSWTVWLVKLPTWFGLYGTAAAAVIFGSTRVVSGTLRAKYAPYLPKRRGSSV
jgi:hypothetical protein